MLDGERFARYPGIPNFPVNHRLRMLGLAAALAASACTRGGAGAGVDAEVGRRGTIEVTARLVEFPEGAIFQRDLYDYATVLRYEVVASHRGPITPGTVIHVGHYNPWKPRAEAADRRVPGVGGTLRRFQAGDLHRMAMEENMEDHFLGGVVDKYFGQHGQPVHWAVWTNRAD